MYNPVHCGSVAVMSDFATPWTAACQASLSITSSQNLLNLMPFVLVMPSNHLILCWPLLLPSIFPSISVFSIESGFALGGQSIGASASALVLPMNIQGWFSLGLISLISLQSKELSRVFSNTTVQKRQSVIHFLNCFGFIFCRCFPSVMFPA